MSQGNPTTTEALAPRNAWRYISFACFAATTPLFAPNTSYFRDAGDSGHMGSYIFPMFVCAIIAAAVVAVLSKRRRTIELAAPARVAVAMTYALAAASYPLVVPLVATSEVPTSLLGAVCGCSSIGVCLMWSRAFTRFSYQRAIVLCCFACLVNCPIDIALTFMPGIGKIVSFILLTLFGAFGSVTIRTETHIDDGKLEEKEDDEDLSKLDADHMLRSFIYAMRMPGVALVLYVFMMSLYRMNIAGIDSEYLGGAIASLLILPLSRVKTTRPLASLIYRVIVPSIAGAIVILASISDESARSICFVCIYVFFSALAILAFAQVVAIINAREFSRTFIVGVIAAIGCTVSLVGLALVHLLGAQNADNTSYIFLLTSLYVAGLLVFLGIDSWKNVGASSETPNEPDTESDEYDIPSSVSSKLTKRENEILTYWGRGHNIVFISEKLFISESTVRTHVKHIYQKLDVHSREELFALLDKEQGKPMRS